MPFVGVQDRFEHRYTHRLKDLLAEHGQFVSYEADRAALDLGLHLYAGNADDGALGQSASGFR